MRTKSGCWKNFFCSLFSLLKSSASISDPQSSASFDLFLDQIYQKYVSQHDQALLDMVFDSHPTQAKLDACMAKADVEVLGAGKCILLSYLMHDHPELRLDTYAGPRISGLIKYYHFHNTRTLSHLGKLGRALNKADLPFVLFKGGAMKALRPDLPRPMGDTDILLPWGTIDQAVKIGESLGYQHIQGKPTHAVGLHTDKEDAVDLHFKLFDDGQDLKTLQANIFARAKAHRAFGVDFFLPCPEDLFFLVMCNFTKNLHDATTLHGLYFALCDSKYLLATPGFNWDIVRENAKLGGKVMEMRLGAAIMNKIVPGLVPDVDRNLPFAAQLAEFCDRAIFDEKIYMPLRRQCQAMRVAELRNYPWLHGKKIIKFLILDKLRTRPWFVRWCLDHKARGGACHAC